MKLNFDAIREEQEQERARSKNARGRGGRRQKQVVEATDSEDEDRRSTNGDTNGGGYADSFIDYNPIDEREFTYNIKLN